MTAHPQQQLNLTDREKEVAFLISFALTDREIAARLFVTVDTVRAHIKSICFKLELPNRTAVCRWVLVSHYEGKITVFGNTA